MNGPSVVFIAIVSFVALSISYLSFTLARRLFPIYRRPKLAYVYWTINLLAVAGTAFGRGRLDIFPFSGGLVQLEVLWFMCQAVALCLLPLYALLKKGIEKMFSGEGAAADQSRRKFIRAAALSLPALTLGVSSYGAFYESRNVRLLRHEIALADLDSSFDSFKIAQLSDVHLGLFFSVEKLRSVLERIVLERPNVLVVTGDLIDDVNVAEETARLLDEFVPRFAQGVYFTWGNHEYFRDFAKIKAAFAHSRVRVLRNQSAVLAEAERPLYLLGVDYPWAKDEKAQEAECARMVASALENVPSRATKILLSHHPALIDYAYANRIDLSLTGHTHGGQVALFGQALLPVRYKYMRGMYRQDGMYGYVSAGAGSWFPFRFGCPAEMALFTLRRA